MITKEEKDQVYQHLVEKNYHHYNLLKASEELQELALILTQKVNKKNNVPDQKIIDEIGDVKIRLKVLEKMFPKELIDERVNKKLTSFQSYIQTEKYKNI